MKDNLIKFFYSIFILFLFTNQIKGASVSIVSQTSKGICKKQFLSISCNPAENKGKNADWWLVLVTPSKKIYHFDLETHFWKEGLNFTYQGPLIGFGGVQIFVPEIEDGKNTIYFGFDLEMNGKVNMNTLTYSNISIDVSRNTSNLEWTFTPDNVNTGIYNVVSPEAIKIGDNVYMYTSSSSMDIYKSSDGLHFSILKTSVIKGGSPSIIKLDNGSYRMYYTVMNENSEYEIHTAISDDGLDWSEEGSTGIVQETKKFGGVPDSIETPDNKIRIYWVDEAEGQELEVIRSAISDDGKTFEVESGYRFNNGFVDPYILKAENGMWIGLFAVTPKPQFLPQKIYLATSKDGLTWQIDCTPVIDESPYSVFDPTAVYLGNNQYRVYYIGGKSVDNSTDNTLSLKSGVLTINYE